MNNASIWWSFGSNNTTTTSGIVPVPGGLMQQGIQNALGQATAVSQTMQIPYPQSYPSGFVQTVPVITEKYPEQLHFMDDTGAIHSFTVEDVYRKLGLKW